MTTTLSNTPLRRTVSGWYLILDYFREHPFVYLFSTASIAGSSVLAVFIPRIVGSFADTFKNGLLTPSGAYHFGLLILITGIGRVSLGCIGRIISAQHGRIITYKIRNQLFKKWETLTPAYYHGSSIGDLLSHALSDVDVIRQVSSMGINITINGLFMLGAALYMMMAHMHWQLGAAGLAPLLLIPLLVRYFGPRIRTQSAAFQAALGGMSQTVEESLNGIRTVKVFGNEEVIINKFDTKVDTIVNEKMKFVRLSSIFGALVPFMASSGFIIVLAWGSNLTARGIITLGDFIAFLLYLTLLRQPLEQLGNMLNIIQRASASLSRIASLLAVEPAVKDHTSDLSTATFNGKLEIKNLTFRYPGTENDVLRNISFSLNPGGSLGIIGPIGCGKTSLAHLLLRLYEPPKGTIFFDGTDIHNINLGHLRKSIAYVPQNGFLFSAPILDNISFSDESADRNRVVKAACITAVDSDISGFPEGYDTEIGERGVRLSGGQKQRVAIARMVYKDSQIRILDDSLSAVDTKAERRILNNLFGESSSGGNNNASTIIISHRLSAVMNCDEIIVLENGSVLERGSHAQLLNTGDSYSRLWNLQSGGTGRSEPVQKGVVEKTDLLEVLLVEDEIANKTENAEESV
jgi:ATP-binding cassette subfamily B protein